jgi:hypothetical protein
VATRHFRAGILPEDQDEVLMDLGCDAIAGCTFCAAFSGIVLDDARDGLVLPQAGGFGASP